MLAFDEATHTYTYDGRRVPNVTSIISSLTDYSMVYPDVLERARQQGVAVHKMVELDTSGELEELPEWMDSFYRAWRKFVDETGFVCQDSEERVYHPTLRYAGTLDLAGTLTNISGNMAIIDVKRSFYAGPAIGLQTAAYQEAYNATPGRLPVNQRYALKLMGTGEYRLQAFNDKGDFTAFLAALTLHRWKEKHGVQSR